MRFIILLFTIIGFITHLYGSEQTSSLDEAKQLSIDHNKPILIDFMTDW